MTLHDSILIAGGNGMLAHAIKQTLTARGHEFAAIDVDTHDLTKEADVARAFAEHEPTLVFNCAAYTNVDKCEEEPAAANDVNGTLVGHLAKACRAAGAALVHYSTDYVFNGNAGRAWRADDSVEPLSAYGRSKVLGEQLLQEHAPARWVIARTQWLYGPHGKNFVETILGAARAGKPLTVVDDQVGSPTYTRLAPQQRRPNELVRLHPADHDAVRRDADDVEARHQRRLEADPPPGRPPPRVERVRPLAVREAGGEADADVAIRTRSVRDADGVEEKLATDEHGSTQIMRSRVSPRALQVG
jgi:hypothetical protein